VNGGAGETIPCCSGRSFRVSDKTPDAGGSTSVTIYGRTYHLRGEDDDAYLGELAALVDSKMREVAEMTGTADTLKVAILTSLNMADESMKVSSKGGRGLSRSTDKRLAKMVTLLDEALAE